jgi:hypothetical protein
MTVTEAKKKLEQLEQEGCGDLPFVVQIANTTNDRVGVQELRVQGSGIASSAEEVVIVPKNDLWFA